MMLERLIFGPFLLHFVPQEVDNYQPRGDSGDVASLDQVLDLRSAAPI